MMLNDVIHNCKACGQILAYENSVLQFISTYWIEIILNFFISEILDYLLNVKTDLPSPLFNKESKFGLECAMKDFSSVCFEGRGTTSSKLGCMNKKLMIEL